MHSRILILRWLIPKETIYAMMWLKWLTNCFNIKLTSSLKILFGSKILKTCTTLIWDKGFLYFLLLISGREIELFFFFPLYVYVCVISINQKKKLAETQNWLFYMNCVWNIVFESKIWKWDFHGYRVVKFPENPILCLCVCELWA